MQDKAEKTPNKPGWPNGSRIATANLRDDRCPRTRKSAAKGALSEAGTDKSKYSSDF
jgi:hypothetical protein